MGRSPTTDRILQTTRHHSHGHPASQPVPPNLQTIERNILRNPCAQSASHSGDRQTDRRKCPEFANSIPC